MLYYKPSNYNYNMWLTKIQNREFEKIQSPSTDLIEELRTKYCITVSRNDTGDYWLVTGIEGKMFTYIKKENLTMQAH